MKKTNKYWFTLVELLVVITILAIISVVAYQNFGWAVDKAVWGRKISDVSTIETALQQYKTDKNYYPTVDVYSGTTNVWWYNSSTWASASNVFTVNKDWEEITSINNWAAIGGWKINWIWTLNTTQIWAKGTISQATLWKQYLSKDLYDPELWDVKVWTWKMVDYWIWRYVYSVYKNWAWTTANNLTWNAYNMAYTIRKDWSDTYVTKVVWDYDQESCFDNKINCPISLIWPWWLADWVLKDWDEMPKIPYPVADY